MMGGAFRNGLLLQTIVLFCCLVYSQESVFDLICWGDSGINLIFAGLKVASKLQKLSIPFPPTPSVDGAKRLCASEIQGLGSSWKL